MTGASADAIWRGSFLLSPVATCLTHAALFLHPGLPLPAALDGHSPKMRRVWSSRSSSAMLLSERRTSSANGACGRQARHDSRRSTACVVRQAGQHTHRNHCLALRAQPIVGENSIGMRLACRSFHAETKRLASSRIWGSVARFAVTLLSGGFMELDKLGAAESMTLTVSGLPEGKFSVRSGTSQI